MLTEELAIPEVVQLWKESMRVKFTSLVVKLNLFQVVTRNEIPSGAQIYSLSILLKRKQNQFHEMSKYRRLLLPSPALWMGRDKSSVSMCSKI